MNMHLSILFLYGSIVIGTSVSAADDQAWATSMIYGNPDLIRERYDDRIMRKVSCFDNGELVASFDVIKGSLKQFGTLKHLFIDILEAGEAAEDAIPINLKKSYVKNSQQEVEAVRTLFSLHDPRVVVSNFNIPGKKAMLVHANELDASPRVWAILSAVMPYEFCEHMLYETGAHEIPTEKQDLFFGAFQNITDQKKKDKLKPGLYRNLYSCGEFIATCNAVQEKRKQKGAPLSKQELQALPEKINWERCATYLLFSQVVTSQGQVPIFSYLVDYSECFNNARRDDGFLHLPCWVLYHEATQKIDYRKEDNNGCGYGKFDLSYRSTQYITDVDVQAFQSIASWYKRPSWVCIELNDNAKVDWKAMQQLKSTSFGKLIQFRFLSKQIVPRDAFLVRSDAYVAQVPETIGFLIIYFSMVCGGRKLSTSYDNRRCREGCLEIEALGRGISNELKSHIQYVTQNCTTLLPGTDCKNTRVPECFNLNDVSSVHPETTTQVTEALSTIKPMIDIENRCNNNRWITALGYDYVIPTILVCGCLYHLYNLWKEKDRDYVVSDKKGNLVKSRWRYWGGPAACTLEFRKKT